MVTTFSAIVFKSTTAHIFHIGDSRIYRYRHNGSSGDLELITTDHRVWISDEKNYLSRAMGIDTHLDIDYKTLAIEQDKSYTVTDGLSEVTDPVFDKSGKYLYFFASTDAGPVKHWFAMSNADMSISRAV